MRLIFHVSGSLGTRVSPRRRDHDAVDAYVADLDATVDVERALEKTSCSLVRLEHLREKPRNRWAELIERNAVCISES